MGSDPVWRLLFRPSGPAILSMTVAFTYKLVDAVFCGTSWGHRPGRHERDLSAGIVIHRAASGTAVGSTSLISRSLGAGDHKNSDGASCIVITLRFLLSGIIAGTCLPSYGSAALFAGGGFPSIGANPSLL